MSLPFVVWHFDGAVPEVLVRVESMGAGRLAWANSKHAAISSGGKLHDTRSSTSDDKARAMERAAAAAWRAEQRLPELVPERRPFRLDEPTPLANGTLTARRPTPPPKAAPSVRPARAPAVAAAPAAPQVAAGDVGPAMPDESAELQLVRARAVEAEAKVAQLQRLLGVVSTERDALRDRADADEMARYDAAHKADELEESHAIERARSEAAQAEVARLQAEKLEALGAEAYAWDLVDLAMRHGLAAVVEARAETATVLRQSGELSRQFGAAREELDALRAAAPAASVPASALLDEVLLARIATEAARRAVRATRDDLRLRALAATFPGGVDELERLALGYADLLRQTGSA